MTQEDKELLLKDLCSRLPYGVKVKVVNDDILLYNNEEGFIVGKESINDDCFVIQCNNDSYVLSYADFKPYLLPLSSMTAEQKKEYQYITERWMYDTSYSISDSIDWLNKNHFDYRGLIEKGLAIDATELNIY